MIPSAEAIFLRAQQAWTQRAVPPYESFRIACSQTFLADQCFPGDIIEFTVRASDGRTFAVTIPQAGAPAKVLLHGGYITGPDGTPLGFYRALPHQPGGVAPQLPPNMAQDPFLPTIATVNVVSKAYNITLVGTERIGGYDCDHLALRPLSDPQRFALRDLWVDEASGNVVQLVYAHDFGNGRWGTVTYRFAPQGVLAIWTIVHIEANEPTGSVFGAHEEHVASELDDVTFPSSMPDADFEP